MKKTHTIRWFLIWATVAVIGGLIYAPNQNDADDLVPGLAALVMFAGIALALLVIGFWIVNRFIWPSVEVAITPIPSPQQIAVSLEDEWDRVPTVLEVQAVHQMLTSRRNEALLTAGLTLGGLYLIGHNHSV